MFKKNKGLLKILLLLPSSLFLNSCDLSEYFNISDSVADKIFPNVWDFLVQFIAFIIMIILIFIFAYKPIKKYIEKRQELMDKEVKDTFKNKKESEENLLNSKKEVALAHQKASKIIEDSIKEANEEKDKILVSANLEATKKIEEANVQIERNQKEAEKELKNEISDVAIKMSSKILEREVNDSDNKKIIDDFVKNSSK